MLKFSATYRESFFGKKSDYIQLQNFVPETFETIMHELSSVAVDYLYSAVLHPKFIHTSFGRGATVREKIVTDFSSDIFLN